MFIRKLVATAAIAIAATGIATVMAHGQAQVADELSVSSSQGEVAYTTTMKSDRALVTLASGKFSLAPEAVNVTAPNGAVVGAIPTTLRMETGRTVTLTPQLNAAGTELTLTPVAAPRAAAPDSPIAFALQEVSAGGIFAGVVIGCVVGILIGIWFFFVGAIVGCAIGAVIGGFIGASI